MPLKQHSAEFIIINMLSHYFYHSLAIDDYTDFILNTKKPETSTMHERWDSLKATNQPVKIYDIHKISYDFIRDEYAHTFIDYASQDGRRTAGR